MSQLLESANVLSTPATHWFLNRLAASLLSALWQGVLLVAAVQLFLQLIPRTTAQVRFVVWAVAFAVLAALPTLNLWFSSYASLAYLRTPHLQMNSRYSLALVALWLVTALGQSMRLAFHAVRLRLLWRSAVPVAIKTFPELSLGKVEVCVSDEVDRPSVIGFFAPRILIPAWLMNGLTSAEMQQIVLHELEHLRRRDDWVNLCQKVGLALSPLNPALLLIDRQLAAERERACDDGVLSRTHAPRAYATCLTTLAERRLERHRSHRLTVLALGAVGAVRRSEFSRRIESILKSNQRAQLTPGAARTLGIVLSLVVLCGAVVLARLPQVISFDAVPEMQPVASVAGPSIQAVHSTRIAAARFENTTFRSHSGADDVHVLRTVKKRRKETLHPLAIATPIESADFRIEQRPMRRLVLLTSWRQVSPAPVLVLLPDGRTFFATYAAEPAQASWLILQL